MFRNLQSVDVARPLEDLKFFFFLGGTSAGGLQVKVSRQRPSTSVVVALKRISTAVCTYFFWYTMKLMISVQRSVCLLPYKQGSFFFPPG